MGAGGGLIADVGRFLRPRPALGAAVLFIAGILAHRVAGQGPMIWIGVGMAGVLIAVVGMRWGWISTIGIAVGLVSAGICAGQLREFYFPRGEISAFAGEEGRLAWVEMEVETVPRLLADPFARFRQATVREHFQARVTKVRTWGGWESCGGDVAVMLEEPHEGLHAGQVVRAVGYLQRPQEAMNPGEFDWAAYCRRDRVLASLVVRRAENLAIVRQAGVKPIAWMQERARALLARGFDEKHSTDRAVLTALLLGDGDPLLRDVREDFQKTGASHLLAISGLHVAVLGAFVFWVCTLLRLRPGVTVAVVSVFVVVYGLTALPSAPAARAIALCIGMTIALLGTRKVDGVQMLALIALGMLARWPMQIYEAGFQLSFGCVLGMMLGANRLRGMLARFRDRDVEIAESFRPATGVKKWMRWTRAKIESVVAAGVVAWAVSLPMVGWHFWQFNPWALPAGIVLSPVVMLALMGGLVKIALTAAMPFGAAWWAHGVAVPIVVMRWVAHGLGALPGSRFPMAAPTGWAIALYYVLLAVALAPMARRRVKVALRGPWALAFAGFAILPLAQGWMGRATVLRVTVLYVGAGQCAVVEAPGAEPVIIDAGSTTISDVGHAVIEPYLKSRGIGHVGWVIMSHGDFDHTGAVGEIARDLGVERTFVSPHFRRHAEKNRGNRALLKELEGMGVGPGILAQGEALAVNGGGAGMEVLWPPGVCAMSSNDCGLVLKVSFGGKSVLFPADIQAPAEGELLKHPEQLHADVVVAPHHGSAEGTTADFLKAVGASVVVSSDDRTPTRKQRAFDQVVKELGEAVYHTHVCGAVTVTIDAKGRVMVTPFRGRG